MAGYWFGTALVGQDWARGVRLQESEGVITSVKTEVEPQAGDTRIDIGAPGMPNLHSHAFQRAIAGRTEVRGPGDDNFWSWRSQMYAFLDRMDPDDAQSVAQMAYVEMLEGGFTRVGEFHYLHHDERGTPYSEIGEMGGRIAAAAESTGIGLTLLPVFYAHANFGGVPPTVGQRRFITDLDTFARLVDSSKRHIARLGDGQMGVAPHSLRAVGPEELSTVAAMGAGGPIHIHAAEQTREVDDCRAALGARPVEWLLDNAGVDEHWCLIHATHMTANETNQLAASGAVAGLCPVTESNLGDGVFPTCDFLRASGRFGVGTDSNVLIAVADELRQLEYAQRLVRRERNVLADGPEASTGGSLYRRALKGGAQALGVRTGFTVGAPADIVAWDAKHPTLEGMTGDQILDAAIFGAHRAVAGVWRGGRQLVSEGCHRDRTAVAAQYRRTLERLRATSPA